MSETEPRPSRSADAPRPGHSVHRADRVRLGRSAFVTSASAAAGVVTSVALDALVMALFGLGWLTDAYFVAATIPMAIISMMSVLASKVIQPMFITAREQSGPEEGWHFLNLLVTIGTWLAVLLGVLCGILSPLIVRIQAPGFGPEAVATSVKLSVLLFLFTALSWPAAVMRVALTGLHEFAIPGSAKFIESAFKMLFVILFAPRFGIYSLAFGTLAGAAAQQGLFFYRLRRQGYRFHHCFSVAHPAVRRAAGLLRYLFAGQLSGMGIEIISNHLSSLLGPGKVAALRFATRIIDTLAGVLANSIVTVAMPAVAGAIAGRDREAAKQHLLHAIHLLLLVTMPVSIWLAFVNRPLIQLIYQRMSFTNADVDLVSGILLMSIPYIFLSPLWGLAELPFFGECDTRTPTLVVLVQSVVCAALTYVLFTSIGLYSYPIGRAVSYSLTAVLLFGLLSWRWNGLTLKSLASPALRIVAASGVMALGVILGQRAAGAVGGGGPTAALLNLALPSTLGAVSGCCVLVPLRILAVSRAGAFPFVAIRLHVT